MSTSSDFGSYRTVSTIATPNQHRNGSPLVDAASIMLPLSTFSSSTRKPKPHLRQVSQEDINIAESTSSGLNIQAGALCRKQSECRVKFSRIRELFFSLPPEIQQADDLKQKTNSTWLLEFSPPVGAVPTVIAQMEHVDKIIESALDCNEGGDHEISQHALDAGVKAQEKVERALGCCRARSRCTSLPMRLPN